MKGKLLSQITGSSSSQSAEPLLRIPVTESSQGYLSGLVTRWRREQNYLGLVKPSTDISHLEKDMVERRCRCGCGIGFRVLKTSSQQYRSTDCKSFVRTSSHDAKAAWRIGMNYMVRG